MLENVPDSAIIGMLISFKRKGKEYQTTEWGYRLYVRLWHVVYPLRALFVHCYHLAVRAARKTGLLPVIKKLLGRV